MLKAKKSKNISESVVEHLKGKKTEVFDTLYFKTGSDILDIVVGGGKGFGYPAGKIINIVGDKSSGKTFLACEIIASAYHLYGNKLKWVYDDAESGFTFDTKALYGVEIMPLSLEDRVKSRTVEEMDCNYRKFLEKLKPGECGIYVVDSLDGLSSDANKERSEERYKAFNAGKDFKKGSYQMDAPKFLSQEFFKNITDATEEKSVLLVIISQVRENIDPMSFEKYSRSGGKALDFYAHTCLWLATVKKSKKKSRVIGVRVKAKTTKSKTPRPFRECYFDLIFDYGLDNTGSNINYLFDLLTETGDIVKNPRCNWDDESKEITYQSLHQFIKDQGKLSCFRGPNPKKADMEVLIEGDAGLQKAFEKHFGAAMDRDAMINYIEENNLWEELKRRVVEKWEKEELAVKTTRQPKYLQS